MYTTQFLDTPKYHRYGEWLREQDADTLHMYFGTATGLGIVESLMLRIEAESDQHAFLVAANCKGWLGTLHIAEVNATQVEFGLIVHRDYRGVGIGDDLLTQGITWARNRGYTELFMHCLGHNAAIRHLCDKHGLEPRDLGGDSETKIALAPATWITVNQELATHQRNLFYMALQQTWPGYQENLG
jgi:GNAT superfamily N-acetyltransferase